MAAIDGATCRWCGVLKVMALAGDCLDRPDYDGTNRPHEFVVPEAAIEAALDEVGEGLAESQPDPHHGDEWWSGYERAIDELRRALLGEVPTEVRDGE